jgi:amino acid transporter
VISKAAAQPRLQRTLTLKDLMLYGIVLISPLAPTAAFGVMSERGHGHVVTAVLIALVAALFTGISYGRMASAYPSAGSAFSYVAQEIHPSLGYVTGWGMVMDYVLNPVVCAIWCAEQSHDLLSNVPVVVWKFLYVAFFTWINLQRVRSTARFAAYMAAAQGTVVIILLVATVHYIVGTPHSDPAFFTRPFYDPKTFTYGGVLGCTSIAVLTYMGFDGISTLSEETKNPRRNILLATVLTCLVVGTLSAAEVYVAQLIWPASEKFPNVVTAYVWVAGRAWRPLFPLVGLAILVGCVGSGVGAQLGAARLLYGMGCSNALPRRFFGVVDPTHRIPRNNVLFLGAVLLMGALFLPLVLGVEMLNYGALIAFMGVNAAAFMRYFVRETPKKIGNCILPTLGFLICFGLWCSLSHQAKVFGSVWMGAGIALGAFRTRGFRTSFSFEVPGEQGLGNRQ